MFDGERYHYAHINTRRSEPLVATDDDNFIRRFSAPYMPVAMAQWEVRERFGNGSTRALAEQVWNAEDFAFYRWFAMFPVLDHAGEEGEVLLGGLSESETGVDEDAVRTQAGDESAAPGTRERSTPR